MENLKILKRFYSGERKREEWRKMLTRPGARDGYFRGGSRGLKRRGGGGDRNGKRMKKA